MHLYECKKITWKMCQAWELNMFVKTTTKAKSYPKNARSHKDGTAHIHKEIKGFTMNRMNFLIKKKMYKLIRNSATVSSDCMKSDECSFNDKKKHILHSHKKNFSIIFFPISLLYIQFVFIFLHLTFSANNKKHTKWRNNDTLYLCAKTKYFT